MVGSSFSRLRKYLPMRLLKKVSGTLRHQLFAVFMRCLQSSRHLFQHAAMPRLNFTGRRKIAKSHVNISVTGIGGIEIFNAELQLGGYDFPESASVIIEAFRQLELVRFDFGTVGNLIPPDSCRLSEFGTLAGLRFRIKVVSNDEPRGRLLAVCDRITPQRQELQSLSRVPLLAVRAQDLGREVWRLDFADEPLLLVNPRIVPKKQLVHSVEFQSLALPEILRSILNRILIVEQIRVPDDSHDSN